LQQLADVGYIDLCYADASSFSQIPVVPYAWQHPNGTTTIASVRSKNISVFGFMSTNNQYQMYQALKAIDSKTLVEFFDDFARNISKRTVVVLDNASVHRSRLFTQQTERWRQQDLYLYFLPPYSPELNKIEILWRFIKYRWLDLKASTCWDALQNALNDVINRLGSELVINFA
jgi:transposase